MSTPCSLFFLVHAPAYPHGLQMLYAVDSNGLVMGLCTSGGNAWFPALDTAAHALIAKKDLTAWVIGVEGDKLLCVLCKVRALVRE